MSFVLRAHVRALATAIALLTMMHVPASSARGDAAKSGTGQSRGIPVQVLEGTEGFRRLLHEAGLEPLKSLSEASQVPAKTIIMIVGAPGIGESFYPMELKQLLDQGASLLIATDQSGVMIDRSGVKDPSQSILWTQFGVVVMGDVNGKFVTIDRDSNHAYRKGTEVARDCPLVDVKSRGRPADIPIFANLGAIATNRPSYLWTSLARRSNVNLRFLADLPADATAPDSRLGRGPRLPIAAGGTVGRGRLLVLADHSIFINCMMLQSDTDNFAFARNCIEWLAGPPGEVRTRVLYYEDGRVRTDFNVPLINPALLLPPLAEDAAFMDKANKFLAALDKDDFLNQQVFRNFSPERALILLGIILAVLLTASGLLKLKRACYRIDSGAPAFSGALARLAPAGDIVEQRYRVMLKEQNFQDAARIVIQDFFAAHCKEELRPIGLTPKAAPEPPMILAQGGWWRRRRLNRMWTRLWGLGQRQSSQRLTPAGFARLLSQLQQLKAALTAGDLPLTEKAATHS